MHENSAGCLSILSLGKDELHKRLNRPLVPVTENVDGTQNAVFYSTLCDVATSDSIAWERAEKWEWTRRKRGRKTKVDLYRTSSLKSKFVKLFGTESMGSLEFHQWGKIPIPLKCRDWRCWWSKSSCCVVLQHHVVLAANSFAASMLHGVSIVPLKPRSSFCNVCVRRNKNSECKSMKV